MLSLNGYTILAELYSGSRYIIYRAVRDADQCKVILKACRSDHPTLSEIALLQHEYQLMQQITSPKVIKAYELIKKQHQLIIVMEDIGGETIYKYAKRNTLSVEDFLRVAIAAVEALEQVHLHQIIHKDINPNNIIINPETFEIKIIDFNISSKLTEETAAAVIHPKNKGAEK